MALIDSLKPNIQAIILDMDGVLWRDDMPIGNLPNIFNSINQKKIRTVFATNNATKDVADYVKKFDGFGVKVMPDQIINSAMAVGHLIKQQFPEGGNIYIVGEQGLVKTLETYGFHHSEEDALCVVAGLDRHITYQKICKATHLIRKGLPFYATNPDGSYPTPRGLEPGAGSIVASIETAADKKAIFGGKPYPTMMAFALDRLGTQPIETLVIGDRLSTDIQGGQEIGCRTALVLTGVSTVQECETWTPKPDLVVKDLESLFL